MKADAATPKSAESELQVQVLTASPEGFLANATLVSGRRDAVLIDAAFTRADARRIVDTIRASGKNLTTVYITHVHPDHYFGLEVIRQAFPRARFVALPAAAASIDRSEQLQDKVRARYPSLALDVILKIGADAALKPK